jgi:hypothetical protein
MYRALTIRDGDRCAARRRGYVEGRQRGAHPTAAQLTFVFRARVPFALTIQTVAGTFGFD